MDGIVHICVGHGCAVCRWDKAHGHTPMPLVRSIDLREDAAPAPELAAVEPLRAKHHYEQYPHAKSGSR